MNQIAFITKTALKNGIGIVYKARDDISRYGLDDSGFRIMHSIDDPDINTWRMYGARIDELTEVFPELTNVWSMKKYNVVELASDEHWEILSQDKQFSALKTRISEGFIVSILEKQDVDSWKEMINSPEPKSVDIITSTPTLEGYEIEEYKGMVYGEVIIGLNILRDFAVGITNVFGGRSVEYETPLVDARNDALQEMSERAFDMGANAVVGVDTDYEVLGSNNSMLMVSVSGTAVCVKKKQ